jgi:hypothetical protein
LRVLTLKPTAIDAAHFVHFSHLLTDCSADYPILTTVDQRERIHRVSQCFQWVLRVANCKVYEEKVDGSAEWYELKFSFSCPPARSLTVEGVVDTDLEAVTAILLEFGCKRHNSSQFGRSLFKLYWLAAEAESTFADLLGTWDP